MRGEPYGGLGLVDPVFAVILACVSGLRLEIFFRSATSLRQNN